MRTLEQEVNRIKSELADIGCKAMFGKTCKELVQEIFAGVAESADASDLKSAEH